MKGISEQAEKVNEPGDSQRERDEVKRVEVVRCATLGPSFKTINQSTSY
jgi:hypothetical protein